MSLGIAVVDFLPGLFLCCDMGSYEINVLSVCLLMYGYYFYVRGRIYTMPCTLVTPDFQRERAFHWGLCINYCTVPSSFCVKPQSLCAYIEMYLSVVPVCPAWTQCDLFWDRILFIKLPPLLERYILKVVPQTHVLLPRCSFRCWDGCTWFFFLSLQLTFDLPQLALCLNNSNVGTLPAQEW